MKTLRTTPAASALTLAWSGDSSVPARSICRWIGMRRIFVALTAIAAPPSRPSRGAVPWPV